MVDQEQTNRRREKGHEKCCDRIVCSVLENRHGRTGVETETEAITETISQYEFADCREKKNNPLPPSLFLDTEMNTEFKKKKSQNSKFTTKKKKKKKNESKTGNK